mgnify:CR=1 FL=1
MSTVISLIPASAPAVPLALTPYAQRTIQRALNLLDKHLRQPGVSFLSATETRDWLRLKMAVLEREEFVALFLDNQHQLLACETLFTGTINHTQVYPREVVKAALKYNAAAMLVAHCHPSGHAEPSDSDRRITERLKQALDLVDIRLLDHLVVGGVQYILLAAAFAAQHLSVNVEAELGIHGVLFQKLMGSVMGSVRHARSPCRGAGRQWPGSPGPSGGATPESTSCRCA